MTDRKPHFTPEPRIWNEVQVAARFGRGLEWWRLRRKRFEKEGFPPVDDFLGGTDSCAIECWFDVRAGLADMDEAQNSADTDDRLLEFVRTARNGTR